ncbi:MAG: acyl-CoA reductase [Sphingobacteriales bacterium JAD_PAG50586_3]|nr:MAG: acyl-CoA reductase [Sphingobacteriales bacterium JAD_PAG50586_3]
MDKNITEAFIKLGTFMAAFADGGPKKAEKGIPKHYYDAFEELLISLHIYNGWFTDYNVRTALKALGESMNRAEMERWLAKYDGQNPSAEKQVGIIAAGNIPMAGFHDFMCVLLSGHKVIVKPSSTDDKLLPFLSKVLQQIEPGLADKIAFALGMMKGADAYIATGSNNSSRYFDYYFGKFPHIIRKNRNSVAVLTGNETDEELNALTDDVFLYFGLGCRSVSKLYIPVGYDFTRLAKAFEIWKKAFENKKYGNNYDYIKAIYLLNKVLHIDCGFMMLKQDEALASPVSVVYFDYYSDLEQLGEELTRRSEEIQCTVGNLDIGIAIQPFGKAQYPKIDEYADGVDTLNFLLNL